MTHVILRCVGSSRIICVFNLSHLIRVRPFTIFKTLRILSESVFGQGDSMLLETESGIVFDHNLNYSIFEEYSLFKIDSIHIKVKIQGSDDSVKLYEGHHTSTRSNLTTYYHKHFNLLYDKVNNIHGVYLRAEPIDIIELRKNM